MFGRARPATIRVGIGPQQSQNGELYVRALSALAILGGHWRHRGGGLFVEAYPTLDNVAPERPDLSPAGTRSLDRARLGELLTAASLNPPIKGLMIWGTNPLVSQIDAEAVRSGLLREDLFTVVLEHFMTDTARHADIVLPSTTQLDHFDVQGSWGHHYVSANHAAIPPLGDPHRTSALGTLLPYQTAGDQRNVAIACRSA
jgi:anaerobic selenocysteine-containing dehydrogenase